MQLTEDNTNNNYSSSFEISKRILQNRLTSPNFNLKSATLLPSLSSLSTKNITLQKQNDKENLQQTNYLKQILKIPLDQNPVKVERRCLSFSKSPLSPSANEEVLPQNLFYGKNTQLSVHLEKEGKFRLTMHSDFNQSNRQQSDRFLQTFRQNQPHFNFKTFSNNQNYQDNEQSKLNSPMLTNPQSTFSLNNLNSQQTKSSKTKKQNNSQITQDFVVQDEKTEEDKCSEQNFQLQQEYFSEQQNCTDRQSVKKGDTTVRKSSDFYRSTQKLSTYSTDDNEKKQIKEKLHFYLSHLNKDFQNDTSIKRLFKDPHQQKQKENLKTFYNELNNELSENISKKKFIPKLQTFAKKIQNMNILKNFMDKKYQKTREQQIKRKKLLQDAKNIDTGFLNYESIVQNLCNNLQQFVQLNRNKAISGKKIQKLYGFNEYMRAIAFDELTGELRNEFNPVNINFVINYMTNLENKRKSIPLVPTSTKQIQSSNNIVLSRKIGLPQDIKQEVIKNIYYFNKTLEDINNQKITEDRNNEIAFAKNEAEVIEQKLYNIILKNRVNNVDQNGIFQELKQGILYNNGNPFYSSNVPLNKTLSKCERANGQFHLILSKNRYQSQCIDNICDQFQQI